ncbi:MAG: tyrosine-type recombinase/integrase [Rhodothalassiaceae bacterium]
MDKVWSPDQVDAFLSAATPEMRIAIILALETGQRQGDLLALTWSAFDGQAIRLTQNKTGAFVTIPVTQRLKRALQNEIKRLSGTGIQSVTVLTRPDGQPWKGDHFRNVWRKTKAAAGIEGVTFNDLRGTAVTALADAGCSVPEICAITRHSIRSAHAILERYLARTATQSTAAIAKLENARRTNSAKRAAKQTRVTWREYD